MHIFPCKTLISFKVVKTCIYFVFFLEVQFFKIVALPIPSDTKPKNLLRILITRLEKAERERNSLGIEGTVIYGHHSQSVALAQLFSHLPLRPQF